MKPSTYSRHSDFRESVEDAAAQWFQAKNYEVNPKSPYILKRREKWPENIILPSVADFIGEQKEHHEAAGESFPLHRYIHHGLSSQAMLFNLVGPLLLKEDLKAMQGAFPESAWPRGELTGDFEVYDRDVFRELQQQPTSIDFVINDSSRARSLFIEAKYVEDEFGGCSVFSDGDCNGRNPASDFSLCYLHEVRGRLYWKHLKKHGFTESSMKNGPFCAMSNHYQFFREMLFALEKGGSFVLLFDQRNPVFYGSESGISDGIMPLLTSFVPNEIVSQVFAVTIQDIVAAIRHTGRHEDWISEFEAKYGLNSKLNESGT